MIRRWLWIAAAGALLGQRAPAQSTRVKDLAAGKFLVASRDLTDPNFAETVVLLVNYDENGAMGLIVNRRTRVPLSRVFDELKEAKGRADPVHVGGPVSRTGVLALLRSRTKPEEARSVFADVYMISTKTLLEQTLAAGAESSAFRVYLGYSGWGPGQLENEVELGGWHIFRGEAATVFDPDPDAVWPRLIKKTELRLAFFRLVR
ncbi:MAG: YqgE/AlgH family protein [Acidobacteria bacterium]|nr:YqgE/AlgH family protein [Acidobacteriota bacterium]